MRVIDPHHWLDEQGEIPTRNLRLRRQMIRVAQFIEYGGQLKPREFRETLVECRRRPSARQCLGLMWVTKTDDESILAYCLVCKTEEAMIRRWQDTDWAHGPMEPVEPDADFPAGDAESGAAPPQRN
jgi:hypothetical protein